MNVTTKWDIPRCMSKSIHSDCIEMLFIWNVCDDDELSRAHRPYAHCLSDSKGLHQPNRNIVLGSADNYIEINPFRMKGWRLSAIYLFSTRIPFPTELLLNQFSILFYSVSQNIKKAKTNEIKLNKNGIERARREGEWESARERETHLYALILPFVDAAVIDFIVVLRSLLRRPVSMTILCTAHSSLLC